MSDLLKKPGSELSDDELRRQYAASLSDDDIKQAWTLAPKDDANEPTIAQRLAWGGVTAIPGILTGSAGGPAGMLVGGLAGFGSGLLGGPPQTAGDAAQAGASVLAGGLASKIPGKGWLANAGKNTIGYELTRLLGMSPLQGRTLSEMATEGAAGVAAGTFGRYGQRANLQDTARAEADAIQAAPRNASVAASQKLRGPNATPESAYADYLQTVASKDPLHPLRQGAQKMVTAEQQAQNAQQDLQKASAVKIADLKQQIDEKTTAAKQALRNSKPAIDQMTSDLSDLTDQIHARKLLQAHATSTGDMDTAQRLSAELGDLQKQYNALSQKVFQIRRDGGVDRQALQQHIDLTNQADAQRLVLNNEMRLYANLEKQIPKMRDTGLVDPTMPPEVKQLFLSSRDSHDFMDKLRTMSPAEIRQVMNNKLMTPVIQQDIGDIAAKDFERRAYNPKSGTFSSIDAAKEAYPLDKLAEIFHSGDPKDVAGQLTARASAVRLHGAFDDVALAADRQSQMEAAKREFSMVGGGKTGTPLSLILHFVGGTKAVAAYKVGKMLMPSIDVSAATARAMSDSKFAQEWHQFLTNNPSAATVQNFPMVAQLVRDRAKDEKK